jgi:uncharacterized protein (TIGR03437 family)
LKQLFFWSFSLFAVSCATAETVTVRSGNGVTPPGRDLSITFLQGPATGDFGHTFTSSDFSAAQTGPAAFVVSPNPSWLTKLSSDPSAHWIGTGPNSAISQGYTALFATHFTIVEPFTSARMVLNYALDDGIGETAGGRPTANTGVYLNGQAICGQSFNVDFTAEHTVDCGDVSPALKVGTNWLYIEDGNAAGPAGLLFSATLISATPSQKPALVNSGIVNSTTLAVGKPVAPGSIASALGSFPVGIPSQSPTTGEIWPTSLGGVSIQVGGIPAPIYYVSNSILHFQVPWELAGLTQAPVTVTANGQTSESQMASLAAHAPGIYALNGSGTGQGAVLDASNQVVDASNPTRPGANVQIYATGLGLVSNQPPTGKPDPLSPLAKTSIPSVYIGGIDAPVLFSGLVPTAIGYYQINVQVPIGVQPGNAVPVSLSIGGVTSNTVTIAVQSSTSANNPSPNVTSVSPSFALSGSGPLTLTITGSGFITASKVTFCTVPHTVTFVDGSRLQITLSASDLAGSGACAVVVTNPPPGGGMAGAVSFPITVPSNPPLKITSLSPSSAFAGSGPLTLTITGTGFSASTIVTFNGVSHPATLVSNAQLTTTLSASDLAVAGNFLIAMISPGGGTSTATFNVTQGVSIAGQWQGTWNAAIIRNLYPISAIFNQNGSTVTGTMLVTNSRCFTSLGTLAAGSIISGDKFVLNVVFGNVRMVVNGARGLSAGHPAIVAYYSVQGEGGPLPSSCAAEGPAGGFTLSQN